MKTVIVMLGVVMLSGCGIGFKKPVVNYEDHNGVIVMESICNDQQQSKNAFKRCAAHMDKWFDMQCTSFTAMYQSCSGESIAHYRQEYNKFCDAADAWTQEGAALSATPVYP